MSELVGFICVLIFIGGPMYLIGTIVKRASKETLRQERVEMCNKMAIEKHTDKHEFDRFFHKCVALTALREGSWMMLTKWVCGE